MANQTLPSGPPIERIEELEPVITERKLWNIHYLFLAVILGIVAIAIELLSILLFDLDQNNALLLGVTIVVIYAITLFFLIEPKILREIKTRSIRTIETEKPVYRTIERPVVREVEKPVIERVYVTAPRKKLNIPRYNYLGSSETKTYHKHGCRFSKLIKRKYKINKYNDDFFKKNNYEPCEYCLIKPIGKLPKKKKVEVAVKKSKTISKTLPKPIKKEVKKQVKSEVKKQIKKI